VQRVDVHCGYLHRGFEKECEDHTWHNLIPYVDRLNYCSGPHQRFRVLRGGRDADGRRDHAALPLPAHAPVEYSRLADHLTCVAASLMELGAMTAFLYLVMIRDYIYEHLADLTGARVTYTYGRVGGLARDLPEGWLTRLAAILEQYEMFIARIHGSWTATASSSTACATSA
jgi:NADH-quinone oxidoreductase subunit D